MGRAEIEKGWLTISLSPKRHMKLHQLVTPKKQRTPLGDKGLGRLSTQRLGQRLELITRREDLRSYSVDGRDESDYNTEYHVAFDWADFTENRTLAAVPLFFDTSPRVDGVKGTKLILTELRDPLVWKGKNLERLTSGLAQLLFPFGKVRPFNVLLRVDGDRIKIDTLADSVRDVALGRFAFDFDGTTVTVGGRIRLAKLRGNSSATKEEFDQLLSRDQGADFFAFLSAPTTKDRIPNLVYENSNGWFVSFRHSIQLRSIAPVLIDSKIANPGSFNGEIDDYLLRGQELDPLEDIFGVKSEYGDFIKSQAGIRVFRDGFGIRPYGFDANDWLGLSKGQTSGGSFYGLRPQNTIGYVALTAQHNGQLVETTSREGFVDSSYSRNFFALMDFVVRTINVDVYQTLRRAYNEYRRAKADSIAPLLQGNAPFKQMRDISASTVELEQRVSALEPRLEDVSSSIGKVTYKIKHEPLFITEEERNFAPLFDELETTLRQVRTLLTEIKELLGRAKPLGALADSLQPRLEILEGQILEFSELAGLGLTAEALSHEIDTIAHNLAERTGKVTAFLKSSRIAYSEIFTYTEYVQSAVSALRKQLSHLAPSLRYVREKADAIDLQRFFDELIDYYYPGLSKSGIALATSKASVPFTVKINKGRLTQIMDNLILNAEYWLRRASERGEAKNPVILITLKSPYILIEDNGLGIDPAIELSLFQPFVTTKPRGQGRGLGLFIASQLLDASGGNISLRPERNQFGRRYIFQVDLSGVTIDG